MSARILCTWVGIAVGGVAILVVSTYLISGMKKNAVDMRGEKEIHVILTDKGWEPSRVIISEGSLVVFSTVRPFPYWPASNDHPQHGIYPDFDSKVPILASSTWSFTPKKGVWGFHDHIRSYYTGVLYVE